MLLFAESSGRRITICFFIVVKCLLYNLVKFANMQVFLNIIWFHRKIFIVMRRVINLTVFIHIGVLPNDALYSTSCDHTESSHYDTYVLTHKKTQLQIQLL